MNVMNHTGIAAKFQHPRAKIDFITTRRPPRPPTNPLSAMMVRDDDETARTEITKMFDGKAIVPDEPALGITIHDPTMNDMRRLIVELPDTQVHDLEIALDWYLRGSTSNPNHPDLQALRHQLHQCIYQDSPYWMRKSSGRKQAQSKGRIDRRTGEIIQDGATYKPSKWNHADNGWATVWNDGGAAYTRPRLYIKDEHGQAFVRLEVTIGKDALDRDGERCGLYLRDLPTIIPNLKDLITPFIRVGMGLRPTCKENATAKQKAYAARRADEQWANGGAAYAMDKGKVVKIKPDSAANRAISKAVDNLIERLKRNLCDKHVCPHGGDPSPGNSHESGASANDNAVSIVDPHHLSTLNPAGEAEGEPAVTAAQPQEESHRPIVALRAPLTGNKGTDHHRLRRQGEKPPH